MGTVDGHRRGHSLSGNTRPIQLVAIRSSKRRQRRSARWCQCRSYLEWTFSCDRTLRICANLLATNLPAPSKRFDLCRSRSNLDTLDHTNPVLSAHRSHWYFLRRVAWSLVRFWCLQISAGGTVLSNAADVVRRRWLGHALAGFHGHVCQAEHDPVRRTWVIWYCLHR